MTAMLRSLRSVSRALQLANWLENTGPNNLDLDSDILSWLAEDAGFGWTDRLVSHHYGLVGQIGNVERLIVDMLPKALWGVSTGHGPARLAMASVDIGEGLPFAGLSLVPANALLAAGLRAFDHGQESTLAARVA